MPRGIYKDKTKYVGGAKGRKWRKGHQSLETRLKMDKAHSGEKNHNWKDGKTAENIKISGDIKKISISK